MLLDFFKFNNDIGEPPYEYNFLINLPEKEYPKYLKKMFKAITGENLNLKNPKTFNEKIQWLKLYDSFPLKTQLTDKVLVRDWIKEKIGEEYLKPVFQVCNSFDEIDFDSLPNEFIIKCNHGCKWHYKIKNKIKFLQIPQLFNFVKKRFDDWMQTEFFPWAGFEMQYKGIMPAIIIEQLIGNDDDECPVEYEVYCFNGKPMYYQKIKYAKNVECCVYDSSFCEVGFAFDASYSLVHEPLDECLYSISGLSEKLAQSFKFVRVDWIFYKGKFYFNEMTFTPFSGFFTFKDKKINEYLGQLLDLKK